MSRIHRRKKFEVKKFFAGFSISNLRKAKMKKRLLDLLTLWQKEKWIQSYLQVVTQFQNELTSTDLSLGVLNQTIDLFFFEVEPESNLMDSFLIT